MKHRGFTLVELVVVVGILTVITGVVLANYGEFGSKILLRNLTYDLALTVREAQIFGISGRFQESDVFTGSPIVLYFDLNNQSNSSLPLFYMFSDRNADWTQDSGENISNYNLGQGFLIGNIQATKLSDGSTVSGIQKIAMRFKRPEPDAEIIHPDSSEGYSDARITIVSPKGEQLSVFVERAGQISVQR